MFLRKVQQNKYFLCSIQHNKTALFNHKFSSLQKQQNSYNVEPQCRRVEPQCRRVDQIRNSKGKQRIRQNSGYNNMLLISVSANFCWQPYISKASVGALQTLDMFSMIMG